MKITAKLFEGYVYGAIQPSAIFQFTGTVLEEQTVCRQLETILKHLDPFEDRNRFSVNNVDLNPNSASTLFITCLDTLNRLCGDQRLTQIRVFKEDETLCFAVPTLSIVVTKLNMNAIGLFTRALKNDNPGKEMGRILEEQKQRSRPLLPRGTNAGSFIAAAAERKIPFKLFNQRYIIFGYGSGSTIFNSSITEKESAIGVSLAKSKVDTNRLLKMSGFPVAEQTRVKTIEDAVISADKIGYPVVLKPENEEQGRGVSTLIQTKSELTETFTNLNRLYQNLILEKHYFGDGYRVYVLDNKVVRVRKLEAAHVIGDGISTVFTLIENENQSEERNSITASMKTIIIDDDLKEMLRKQNLELSDTPKSDQKVLLAKVSNLSRGGRSVDFMQDLHPENRRLCEDVTKTVGLYCSGVDLISSDASMPWQSNGTIVCEVNAQPQIGSSGKVLMHDQMIAAAQLKTIPISLHIKNQTTESQYSLFNKCLNELKVTLSVEDVLKFGCPVQYFNTLEFSDDVPEFAKEKMKKILVSVKPDL